VRSAQPWKQWAGGGGEVFLGHDQGAFEATAFPGIVARKLHVDPDAGRSTMLVRMAPGTRFPGHRHGGYEECYVLSGDLHHGSRVMRGGDFEWVDTGSRHGEQWTEEGCLLLIHSSHADVLD
jgi:anti-sigma factor ChrR (cupin superfamily)